MIHASVLRIWNEYSQPLEGRCDHMYLDVKGLVTTGVGNLIDSMDAALRLPWTIGSSGPRATEHDIRDEWSRVKRMDPARGARYYRNRTMLRISDTAITDLVFRVVASNAEQLERSFPEWPTWPADAQLGALSRAWAAGPGLERWPRHRAACERRSWLVAGEESLLVTDGNPGVVPRNERQRVAFGNAHVVDSRNDGALDYRTCYWPLQLVE